MKSIYYVGWCGWLEYSGSEFTYDNLYSYEILYKYSTDSTVLALMKLLLHTKIINRCNGLTTGINSKGYILKNLISTDLDVKAEWARARNHFLLKVKT